MALLKADNGTVFNGQDMNGSSRRSLYAIPQFGFNHMLDENRSVGVSIVGNGVGTGYSKRSNIGGQVGGGAKFQAMVSTLSYSHKVTEKHSIGLGLMLLYQRLEIEGTSSLGLPEGKDSAYGAGLRMGYHGQLSENFSIGASLASQGYMQRLNTFKRLLAEGGRLNKPATASLGVAYKHDNWVVGVDVQHICWQCQF